MTADPAAATERFRVDLRGVVEILSHHLYSSPRVFVRELLQNARDALVARKLHEPTADGVTAAGRGVRLWVEGDDILVEDDGIGLTAEEMGSLLATIGASSKRDDLVRVREDFLGRFGIGLLSCFLVADSIEVESRSARTPDAPTVRWVGNSDGTYVITGADRPRGRPGTLVRVHLRREETMWASSRRLARLAGEFARYLDVAVDVVDATGLATRVSGATLPEDLDPLASAALCRELFGFDPLTTLRLEVPVLGIHGVAYVTPYREATTGRAGDMVYSNGILVADDNIQLAPSWAYFARLVIDAGSLPLTASRESFQETALTTEAAERIGAALRTHIVDLATSHPDTFRRFVAAHGVGLRAMSLEDPAMFSFVYDFVPFTTSRGDRTLADLVDGTDTEPGVRVLHQTFTESEFDALAPLARAQGFVVVDASHVHEPQVLHRLATSDLGVRVEHLDLRTLVAGAAPAEDEQLAARVRQAAAPALPDHEIEVVDFGTPALAGLELAAERDWDPDDSDTPAASGWGSMMGVFGTTQKPRGPRLVLNLSSPLVRVLGDSADPEVHRHVARALYVLGVLHSGASLRGEDHLLLAESLSALAVAATRTH